MENVYAGINICFLYGKIITPIDLQFFYNSKIHNSIVEFQIVVGCEPSSRKKRKQTLNIRAYDDHADFMYRKYQKDKFIKIIGELNSQYIVVKEIL